MCLDLPSCEQYVSWYFTPSQPVLPSQSGRSCEQTAATSKGVRVADSAINEVLHYVCLGNDVLHYVCLGNDVLHYVCLGNEVLQYVCV